MSKIIFIISILLLTSFSLVKSDECESLKCLDHPTNDSNICSYEDEEVTYYRKCSPGYECKREKESNMNRIYTCQVKSRYKEEGSSCVLSDECITNICKDNKCISKVIGDECKNDLECSKDAYCNEGFCKASGKEGDECSSYKGCLAGYSCGQKEKNATKRICIADFSIPNGEYASIEIQCESAQLDYDTNLCYDIESKVPEGTSCNTSSDCPGIKIVGKEITDTTLSCKCTWDQQRICEFGSKSKRWTSYISYYKTEMQKKRVSGARVAISLFDFTDTNDWNINNYYYKTIPALYNAPSCLLDAINYSNSTDEWIKLSFVFLFAFILLI